MASEVRRSLLDEAIDTLDVPITPAESAVEKQYELFRRQCDEAGSHNTARAVEQQIQSWKKALAALPAGNTQQLLLKIATYEAALKKLQDYRKEKSSAWLSRARQNKMTQEEQARSAAKAEGINTHNQAPSRAPVYRLQQTVGADSATVTKVLEETQPVGNSSQDAGGQAKGTKKRRREGCNDPGEEDGASDARGDALERMMTAMMDAQRKEHARMMESMSGMMSQVVNQMMDRVNEPAMLKTLIEAGVEPLAALAALTAQRQNRATQEPRAVDSSPAAAQTAAAGVSAPNRTEKH